MGFPQPVLQRSGRVPVAFIGVASVVIACRDSACSAAILVTHTGIAGRHGSCRSMGSSWNWRRIVHAAAHASACIALHPHVHQEAHEVAERRMVLLPVRRNVVVDELIGQHTIANVLLPLLHRAALSNAQLAITLNAVNLAMRSEIMHIEHKTAYLGLQSHKQNILFLC